MSQFAPDPGAVDDETPPGHIDAEPPEPRTPVVVEKQASWIVLPVRNVCEVSVPVSITATDTPEALAPSEYATGMPIRGRD
jgi:hypothetical protein